VRETCPAVGDIGVVCFRLDGSLPPPRTIARTHGQFSDLKNIFRSLRSLDPPIPYPFQSSSCSIFDGRSLTEVGAEQRHMNEGRHRMRLLTANGIEDEDDRGGSPYGSGDFPVIGDGDGDVAVCAAGLGFGASRESLSANLPAFRPASPEKLLSG
jgi:hypothetical protein